MTAGINILICIARRLGGQAQEWTDYISVYNTVETEQGSKKAAGGLWFRPAFLKAIGGRKTRLF